MALIFADDFNRADTAVGGVANGWADLTNRWQIVSNQLVAPSGTGPSRLTRTETGQSIEATVTWISSGTVTRFGSILFMASVDTWYTADFSINSSTGSVGFSVNRVVAGGTAVAILGFVSVTSGIQNQNFKLRFSVESNAGLTSRTVKATILSVADAVVSTRSVADTTAALQGVLFPAVNPGNAGTTFDNFSFDTIEVAQPGVTIPVTNSALYFSQGWYFDAANSKRIANRLGQYLKFNFTGATLSLNVDTANMAASGSLTYSYSVDGGVRTAFTISKGATSVPVVTGLSTGTHSIIIYYDTPNGAGQAFTTNASGYPENALVLTGLALATGGTVSTCTVFPVRSEYIICFGDSITSALSGNSSAVYPFSLAFALGTEYDQQGFSGIGWTVALNGNTPPFPSTWNNFYTGVARTFTPQPKYVFICMGTNDNGATQSVVQTAIFDWLTVARTTFPGIPIFVIQPFSGRINSTVTAGFNQYQAATPDSLTYLVNLQMAGLLGNPGLFSTDGIHPILEGHSLIASSLAARARELTTTAVRSPLAIERGRR